MKVGKITNFKKQAKNCYYQPKIFLLKSFRTQVNIVIRQLLPKFGMISSIFFKSYVRKTSSFQIWPARIFFYLNQWFVPKTVRDNTRFGSKPDPVSVVKLFIFGSPDVFRLRKEPISSLSYVRSFVRPYVRSGPTALAVQYFFLIFCMKLCLHMTQMTTKKFFGQKIF